ncbi:low-specificity L-threonine aldolase [Nitrincola sp. MINF-07-Sa-05]|uniref:low-specificity L-threonine aldolase n=1 Tax=Nitrincola salilacus TaxID=3400273 RepID=UPI0039181CFA
MLDFRSDTVTTPTTAMREAMANAPVGDDVYGDDPTVNELEAWTAKRHGFEAALFTSSGTQANLLALMSHCQRGDEYLCGQLAHNYKYEAGGAAVLGSIQPQPIENEADGSLSFEKLAAAVKPDDFHFARTRLLSLENTIGGKVLTLEYMQQAREFCDEQGLALHLDGARIYNAAVALGVDVAEVARPFDSITICLSKGLCAPVGSLLLGTHELIASARRIRKMLGGGMRQVGILAAAGKLAMTEQVARLADDHANAIYLGEQLDQLPGITVKPEWVNTNILYADLEAGIEIEPLRQHLKEAGFLVSLEQRTRFVTHKDIDRAGIERMIQNLRDYLASR